MKIALKFALLTGVCAWSSPVLAQTEAIFTGVGMDTPLVFAQSPLTGSTGIDFRFFGAFAPGYPIPESHAVVIDFEWGPSPTGPWTVSPDNVTTVPAAMTHPFDTGVYHATSPDATTATFVRLHFYAGGLMTASGTFQHLSVPGPGTCTLAGVALAVCARRPRRGLTQTAGA